MCKIRFPKYVNNLLNILGRDVFILKPNLIGAQAIRFQGEKIRYSGNYALMRPPRHYFDETQYSPDEITEYELPHDVHSQTVLSCVTCYNPIYLEINGQVYIDRR